MPSSTVSSGMLEAKIDLLPFKTTEMLYISNFGFQVPEDSHIEGIVVIGQSSGIGLAQGHIRVGAPEHVLRLFKHAR